MISHFPYPVYRAFLKYLYTDKLEILSMEEMLGTFVYVCVVLRLQIPLPPKEFHIVNLSVLFRLSPVQ